MDWLLRPLIFCEIFLLVNIRTEVLAAGNCTSDKCYQQYRLKMNEAGITDPEYTSVYCSIMKNYMNCLTHARKGCRGDLTFHATEHGVKAREQMYCLKKTSDEADRDNPKGSSTRPPPTTPIMYPSCKYFGTYQFRHCGFYGDPHLKTFNGQYQTCRVHGNWTLIDNAYMSVQVTNEMLVEGSPATAPTKISVVVKNRSNLCTLQKRYEASSDSPLPVNFLDGTDQSGPDRTVTLNVVQYLEEDRETAEIVMKYIATKIVIRRKGKYLAFNVKLPEEVMNLPKQADEDVVELCKSGCPVTEQLDIVSALGHMVEREEALRLCKNTENLSEDIANNLTDNYLDWCVFDIMTAGKNKDFIDAAHSAQSDALKLDFNSLQNRTTLTEIPYNSIKFNAGSRISNFQLPFCIMSFILIMRMLLGIEVFFVNCV